MDKEQKNKEEIIDKEVVVKDELEKIHNQFRVHTMPKLFLDKNNIKKSIDKNGFRSEMNTGQPKNKAMIVGVSLIFLGIFFLVFIGLFYLGTFKKITFFNNLFQKDIQPSNQIVKTIEETATTSEENQSQKQENIEEENIIDPESIVIDTASTSLESIIASSTDNVASSTVIDSEKISENIFNFVSAQDTDGDGLSDEEEKLFLSDINLSDSDNDTYLDLVELLGLYNPAGSGTIMNNLQVDKYLNNVYNYNLYYPRSWIISNLAGESSVILKASNNQFVQIMVEKNEKKQTLEDWYKEQVGVEIIKDEQILEKNNWKAIRSENSLVVYLSPNTKNDYFFIVSYNIGVDNVLYFKNIFEMMVKSLELI